MNFEDAKEFIKFLSNYIEECEGSPHNFGKEVRFYLGDDEIELDFNKDKKQNTSFACDVQTTMGCGCWLGVDIKFRKKSDNDNSSVDTRIKTT